MNDVYEVVAISRWATPDLHQWALRRAWNGGFVEQPTPSPNNINNMNDHIQTWGTLRELEYWVRTNLNTNTIIVWPAGVILR